MAVKQIKPAKATIYARGRNQVHSVPPMLAEAPGGLHPLRLAVHQLDEYRVMAGWPVEVPPYDIHAEGLVSAEGEVLHYRDSARAVETGALVRWIADDDTYDLTSLRWYPYQGTGLTFDSAADFAPTYLPSYEYRVGQERFYQDAINFDSDEREHFWCNLGSVLGGAAGYTVVMSVSMNSVFGNNPDQVSAGIWGPGRATPVGDTFTEDITGGWMQVELAGGQLTLETNQTARQEVLPVGNLLSSSAPMMLAFVFGRPYTQLYAGRGPSSIRSASVFAGEDIEGLTGDVVLGRTNGDVLHTSDMALLDIGLYGDRLSAQEVQREFALLSSAYGGDK